MNNTQVEMINAGVPGENVEEIQARLTADVLTRKPDLVILLVGTNDALNSRKLTEPARFAARYPELCAAVRRETPLVVCTILPCHLPFLMTRHDPQAYQGIPPEMRTSQVNAVIRQTAAALALPLVDLHTVFATIGDIGEAPASLLRNPANSGVADGVHPTAQGYRLIAALVYQTLLTAGLTGAQRVVCLGDSITNGQNVAGAGTATGDTYPAILARLLEAAKIE